MEPFADVFAILRERMIEEWALDPAAAIPETGDTVLDAGTATLPFACIERTGEALLIDSAEGKPLHRTDVALPLRLWLFQKNGAGQDDLTAIRTRLFLLFDALRADRKLDGAAYGLTFTAFNEAGVGVVWPVNFTGDAARAGYLGLEINLQL